MPRGFKPSLLRDEVAPAPAAAAPAMQVDARHLKRLLQSMLVEIRSVRQYITWLHELLAQHELGREAGIPDGEQLKERAARKRVQKAKDEGLRALLASRAAMGHGNGGLDLTPEEQRRIAAGEPLEDVLGV